MTLWALGTVEGLGGAASGGRHGSRGKAGGTEGWTGEGTRAFLPSSVAQCSWPGRVAKLSLVFSSWDLPCAGLVRLCSPSRLRHSARAGGSTHRQTARTTCLIAVSGEWPCCVAFVLMESKCQRDVNTGQELAKSPTGNSRYCSPMLSQSMALSIKGSTSEPLAGRISPRLSLAEVFQGELIHSVLKSRFARRWPGPRMAPTRPCPLLAWAVPCVLWARQNSLPGKGNGASVCLQLRRV